MPILSLFLVFFLSWNVLTYLFMLIDKNKAKKNKWRIPEKTLLTCSFLMGAVGIFLGMINFRHKTQHKKFQILVPISLVVNAILLIFLLDKILSL